MSKENMVSDMLVPNGNKLSQYAGMEKDEWNKAIKFNSTDFGWVIMCIGMAIGAGIVFLPVQVGRVGLWVYIISGVIGYPALWLSQRLYVNTLALAPKCENYPSVIAGYLGKNWGFLFGFIYFVMLMKGIFTYSIASTRDSASFLHTFGVTDTLLSDTPLWGLAVLCVLVLLASRGEKALFKIASGMVLTKLGVIIALGLVMIPHWDLDNVVAFPELGYLVKEVIIMMPFTITSLLFSQCLSPLVISYRGHHDNIAVAKYKSLRAMNIAYIVLFLAVVFYAISFNLTMSQEEAIIAFHNNISALAMVAQSSGTTVQIFSFVLNIFAVVTAFFGAFLGFKEALYGLTMNVLRRIWNEDQLNPKYIRMGIYAFAILIPWLVVVINIPILSMFIFISPVYGIVNCLIPLYLVVKVPSLAQLRQPSLFLVFLAGVMLCLAPFLEFLF